MMPLLQANHISFTIRGRINPILAETSLSINEGEFVVVLGHNGSGKSTLIKLLSGAKSPSSGNILLENIDLKNITALYKATNVITLSQRPEDKLFDNLTLEENIILWESRFQNGERLSASEICNYTTRPARFMNSLKHKVHSLSGGEKQIFLFALTMSHPPKFLFLDEHTSALDPKSSNLVMEITASTINLNKVTTIMVTHKLEDALKYGNRIIVINEGIIKLNEKKSPDLTVASLKNLMECG